jgi:hypothetical protein
MVERLRTLAFRAAGHHLAGRLGKRRLNDAVGAIGIRRSQGAALLALHARVEGIVR